MKKLLLFIKKVLYKLGIDISFVRKEDTRSAIEMNDMEVINQAWSNEKYSDRFLAKPVLERYKETLTICTDHAVDLSGKSVMDVGCGNGMLLKTLSQHYNIASQNGMEYAAAALELAAKNNPPAKYIVHDINLPYTSKYDAVLCTEVLEHILYPTNAFKNLLEMVEEGGVLLITVPNGRMDTFSGHINFWSHESWGAFISENTGGLNFVTGKVGKHLLYSIVYKGA